MRLNPVRFFTSPITRPRAIIWAGVALIVFIVFWAVALDGTSTYAFCTAPCHIVHDDNTLAYLNGSHTNVSCVACHEPVNTNPLKLSLLKIEVAPDAIKTIQGTFELPMNATSYVALEMPTEQCTQCHNLDTRTVTPARGLRVDHAIHAENDIRCTVCHNRVAHPEEDITLVLKGDRKHDNWLTMDGCFRCHGKTTAGDKTPPSECNACHTPSFKLIPASHESPDWYKLYGTANGHAKAATEESSTVAESRAFAEKHSGEIDEGSAEKLMPSSAVNSCYTCHAASFCESCHGLEIPHAAAFKKNHSKQGFSNSALCAKCHARSAEEATGLGYCNACHHPASTPGTKWLYQHPSVMKQAGATACYACHNDGQCAYCHVNGPARFRAIEDELW